MDESSRSVRRSRVSLSRTPTDILNQGPITLHAMMEHFRENNVPGPFVLRDCHRGAVHLGSGAQFAVFGRRMRVSSSFPDFDRPYLDPLPRVSDINLYVDVHGKPQDWYYTLKRVAIKRANIVTTSLSVPTLELKTRTGKGVERSQLRDTIQEMLALTHPLLRQHPNIISILAWGYDHIGDDRMLFSPLLFVEHANMSLGKMCYSSHVPWEIKKHLCSGMILGIKALHESGIVHNDVKPDNILVFAKQDSPFFCIAKIADFGISERDFRDDRYLPKGTAGWAAPEQENSTSVPVELVHRRDIWGCGMAIWSVMALKGSCPGRRENPIICLRTDFENACMPATMIETLLPPIQDLLHVDVAQRANNLEGVRSALRQSGWDDVPIVKER